MAKIINNKRVRQKKFELMNIFPSGMFRCHCGHYANYSLIIKDSKQLSEIIHSIHCTNCGRKVESLTGENASNTWMEKNTIFKN